MPDTDFTANWFETYAPEWERRLSHFRSMITYALEIGSYEGRSACWMLDNLLVHKDSRLICVDPWSGDDETLGEKTKEAEARFDFNIGPYSSKVTKIKDRSLPTLCEMFINKRRFNLIYVDGSHEGMEALTDLVLCWHLVLPNGWLIFDDARRSGFEGVRVQPKYAWKTFALMRPRGLRYEYVGRQVFAQKVLS